MKEEHPYRHDGMYKGAPAGNFQRANLLRQNMTVAETLLWERIKDNQLGEKIRRQHPIQLYIADFYCHKFRVVIEVDGDYHNSKEQILKDIERSSDLRSLGLEIIRFTNKEILNDLESVIKAIKEKLDSLPQP